MLALLALIAYWPSFQGAFVLDDWTAIVRNPAWRDWSTGWQRVRDSARWLGDLTLWLNVRLAGPSPADGELSPVGFHVVNFAAHLLTGGVLWYWWRTRLLPALFDVDAGCYGGGPEHQTSAAVRITNTPAQTALAQTAPERVTLEQAALQRELWISNRAWVCTAIWLVHPLTTAAVTYIVQRYEVLASLGIVAGLCCYTVNSGGHLSATENRRRWWLANGGTALCLALALGAKQTAFMLPLLTLLAEVTLLTGTVMTRLRERGMFYLLSVPVMFLVMGGVFSSVTTPANPTSPETIATRDEERSIDRLASDALPTMAEEHPTFAGFSYRAVSPWEYLRSQGPVLCHYGRLILWPDRLCFDYSWPVASSWWNWLPGCLVVALLLVMGFVLCGRRSPWGFLILAPFLVLAPTSSLLPLRDLAVEHRLYLPLAFVVGGVVLLVDRGLTVTSLGRRAPWLRPAGVAGILLMLCLRTYARNQDYRTEVELWRQTWQAAPENPRAAYNYGHALLNANDPAAAMAPLQQAIALSMTDAQRRFVTRREMAHNHNRLANAWHLQQNWPAATAEYERALAWDNSQGLIYHNQALAWAAQGEFAQARQSFARARQLLPNDPAIPFDWGQLAAQMEDWTAAVELYTAALTCDPQHSRARLQRGLAEMQRGAFDRAQQDLRASRELFPPMSPERQQIDQLLNWIAQQPR